jgi:hypothetical protein
MLPGLIATLCLLAFDTTNAIVLDRVAIAVGRRAIKSSDIDRDLRVTAFLNNAPLDTSNAAKKRAAERLIDQQIIREEIATGQYARANEGEAAGMLDQIRTTRFRGSDAQLRAALARYGITQSQLQDQLLWQLTVLRFIDARFRPSVQVSDDDVRKYYDTHLAELKRQYPRDNSFETLEPKVRETMEASQTDKQFEEWIAANRKSTRIEYHQEALK